MWLTQEGSRELNAFDRSCQQSPQDLPWRIHGTHGRFTYESDQKESPIDLGKYTSQELFYLLNNW